MSNPLRPYHEVFSDERVKDLITSHVDKVLGLIDNALESLITQPGKNSITIKLGNNYCIPTMSKIDARVKIYYYIIVELEKQGYQDMFVIQKNGGDYYLTLKFNNTRSIVTQQEIDKFGKYCK
jgi:hypothetical protein